jgi:hypothetical protein
MLKKIGDGRCQPPTVPYAQNMHLVGMLVPPVIDHV